jgi:alkylation response protein AidB-like acyl-CoA dehydrogenase
VARGEPPEFASLADEVAFLRGWQRQLAEGGWVGIHWPRDYGGRGASVIEHYIFQEEIAAARASGASSSPSPAPAPT